MSKKITLPYIIFQFHDGTNESRLRHRKSSLIFNTMQHVKELFWPLPVVGR